MSKMDFSIFIVDDDPDVLLSAELLLQQFVRDVRTAHKATDLLPRLAQEGADLLLLDMNFTKGTNTGEEGLNWIRRVKDKFPDLVIVVMTAYADIDLAVEATKLGAFDFIQKPWENARLLSTVQAGLQLAGSKKELSRLKIREKAWSDQQEPQDLIFQSVEMADLMEQVKRVAPTEANVLILGENGTGKELIAKSLHAMSGRASKPMVAVDLGAVHAQLFESELFGAKKGAYTDLKQDKTGRMELAHEGSLFLDEIGNLPLDLQVKLLAALQRRSIIPLGAVRERKIDIRLISATNQSLVESVEKGEFRQDLLYRINTVVLEVPSLRERNGDVSLLVQHFLKRFNQKYKRQLRCPEKVVQELEKYNWPGNVRELEHAVERAVIMSKSEVAELQDFLPVQQADHKVGRVENLNLMDNERELITAAIEKHKGNISQAAKALGLTRTALYRRLEKHGLND